MNSQLIKRRRELLKQRSLGLSLSDVVKDLATKYGVSLRTVYYDWQHRKQWMEDLLDIEDPETLFLELIATHQEIKRYTVKEYLIGDNSNARIGALRLLRELNKDFEEMIVTKDIIKRVKKLEEKTN